MSCTLLSFSNPKIQKNAAEDRLNIGICNSQSN